MSEKEEIHQVDEERPKDQSPPVPEQEVEPVVTPKTWGVVTVFDHFHASLQRVLTRVPDSVPWLWSLFHPGPRHGCGRCQCRRRVR